VVNLRKPKTTDDLVSESGDSETSSAAPASEPVFGTRIPEPEDFIITPPHSPQRVRFRTNSIDLESTPRKSRTFSRPALDLSANVPEQAIAEPTQSVEKDEPTVPIFSREHRPSFRASSPSFPAEKREKIASAIANAYTPAPILTDPSPAPSSILEQAWVMKMAGEIARRAHDEKAAREGFWSQSQDEREETPPPAYQAKAM
jgi:distribution and morphology protein 34